MSDDPMTGGCQCDAVRYELSAPPIETYVCHCLECRGQSSSAFGISVIARADALRVTKGAPKTWTRQTESGGRLDCAFCGTCGARLWHRGDRAPETLSVKGGSLDEPVDLTAARHIWTSRRLPGIMLPENVESFPEEPE